MSVPTLADRTLVLLNAVPGPPQFVPPRGELSAPVRLLYLGRLSPRKGPDIAIQVAGALRESGLDVQVALLGAPFSGYEWYRDELERLAAAPILQGRVAFLGFDNDVWPHLQEADIVLVPTRIDEPFGNTAVEAVLAGRPLVFSDTSGLREAAAGYSITQAVPPDALSAWTVAVQNVLEQWGTYAVRAKRNAEVARDRHSPATFRRRLAGLVLAGTEDG